MKPVALSAAALLLLGSLSLHALDLKQGDLKLVLTEDTGRFSLYYLEDAKKNQYQPLFFSDDPRTSVLTIMQDGKLYRMGDSSAFQMSLEHNGNTAAFVWKSSTLTVTEEFSFSPAAGQAAGTGILITLRIRNTGNESSQVGARYLIDTILGEHSAAHFQTQAEGPIRHETQITPSPTDSWVLSAASDPNSVGLKIVTYGPGVTTPDRVVLANWKRLNESPWDYDVNSSRDFNLLPYSINDSAVALYYNSQNLSPGASRTITIAIGTRNAVAPASSAASQTQQPAASPASQSSGAEAAQPLAQPKNNVVNNGGARPPKNSELERDYEQTKKLLDQINQLLSQPPGTVSPDQINELQQELKKLEDRRSQYGQ
ncbi:hypothetical protein [Salinispira pacifica]